MNFVKRSNPQVKIEAIRYDCTNEVEVKEFAGAAYDEPRGVIHTVSGDVPLAPDMWVIKAGLKIYTMESAQFSRVFVPVQPYPEPLRVEPEPESTTDAPDVQQSPEPKPVSRFKKIDKGE